MLLRLVTFFCATVLVASQTSYAELVNFGSGSNAFTMEFVPIGNPGNVDDIHDQWSGTTGVQGAGGVAYAYNMGKFEVSRDMITKASAEGGLGITLYDMASLGGNGVNRPATGVSWNEAARFVNWLNTDSGGFAAYNTSGGVNDNIALWTPSDTLDYDAANPFRSIRTKYVLPSLDEWYKAAYYDPNANSGLGGYWLYPTGSDSAPTVVASGTVADTAVYDGQLGPADIDQAGGLSPYGTMGQGGNVWEWDETDYDLVNDLSSSPRGTRGGSWVNLDLHLKPTYWFNGLVPQFEITGGIGFRVASIPEPSSFAMFGIAMFGMARRRRQLS